MIDPTAAQGQALTAGSGFLDAIIRSRKAALDQAALEQAVIEKQRQNAMGEALIGPAMLQAISQSLGQVPALDLSAINKAANRAAGVYEDVNPAQAPQLNPLQPTAPSPMNLAQVNMGAIGAGAQAIREGLNKPAGVPVQLVGPGGMVPGEPVATQVPATEKPYSEADLLKALGLIPRTSPAVLTVPPELGGGQIDTSKSSMAERTPQGAAEPAVIVQPDGSEVVQGDMGPQTISNLNIFDPKVFKFVANELMKQGSVAGTAIMSQPTTDTLKAMEQQRVLAAGSVAKLNTQARAAEAQAELKKYEADISRMNAQDRLVFQQLLAQFNGDIRLALEAMRIAGGLARDKEKPPPQRRGGSTKPDRYHLTKFIEIVNKAGVYSPNNMMRAKLGISPQLRSQLDDLAREYGGAYAATRDPAIQGEFRSKYPDLHQLAVEKGFIGGGSAAPARQAAPAQKTGPKKGDRKTLSSGRTAEWDGQKWNLVK